MAVHCQHCTTLPPALLHSMLPCNLSQAGIMRMLSWHHTHAQRMLAASMLSTSPPCRDSKRPSISTHILMNSQDMYIRSLSTSSSHLLQIFLLVCFAQKRILNSFYASFVLILASRVLSNEWSLFTCSLSPGLPPRFCHRSSICCLHRRCTSRSPQRLACRVVDRQATFRPLPPPLSFHFE
jgi:hypothetical protein